MQPLGEQPIPRKSGSNGCLIVLGIIGGIFVLGVLGVFVAGYLFMQRPEVKEVMGAMGDMFNAPGRQELMQAGCEQAMVMDMSGFAKLAEKDQNSRPQDIEMLKRSVFITCAFNGPPSLDCNKVAEVYRSQVSQERETHVIVQQAGQQQPVCTARFDPSGKYLGEAMAPPAGGTGPAAAKIPAEAHDELP